MIPKVIEILHQASKLKGEERANYLDEACGGDNHVRAEVEGLLRAHDSAGSFMDTSGIDKPDGTRHAPPVIDRYKLLDRLGEGGFGVVYEAEQTEPIRRRVAIKVIKPGMDSEQVVTRFEAERQALALMEHPCIARVLDGGLTADGRPYFVMELVRGVPITTHCDTKRLSIPERIKLCAMVCEAVQHAHAKGVVHRDLKPSNILIEEEFGTPKVIDFGIAKALDQRLTEATIFTEQGQLIGTPQYMSPEQASMGAIDIDTRTDVYSLGAILYELLTGLRPFEPDSLRQAGFAEIQRIIREVEPERPSTRLSRLSTDSRASGLAEARRADTRSLATTLRRDLDWVVMKCLEKDRERRYETVSALAEDLIRFVENQPVLAGPPSAGYKLSKFARRNKNAVIASVTMAALLISGLIGTSFGLYRANAQRILAEQRESEAEVERGRAVAAEQLASQRLLEVQDALNSAEQRRNEAEVVTDFFVSVLRVSSPSELGPGATIRQAIDRAAGEWSSRVQDLSERPSIRARLIATIGWAYATIGMHTTSVPYLTSAREIMESDPSTDPLLLAQTLVTLGTSRHRGLGETDVDSLQCYERALQIRRAYFPPSHPAIEECLHEIAAYFRFRDRTKTIVDRDPRGASPLYELLMSRVEEQLSTRNDIPHELRNRVNELIAQDLNFTDAREVAAAFEESITLVWEVFHPHDRGIVYSLAVISHEYAGNDERAHDLLTTHFDFVEETLGASNTAYIGSSLATSLERHGRIAEAIVLYRQSELTFLQTTNPESTWRRNNLGMMGRALFHAGRFEECVPVFRELLSIESGGGFASLNLHRLVRSFIRLGRHKEADEPSKMLLELRLHEGGTDHYQTTNALRSRIEVLVGMGQYDEAFQLIRIGLVLPEDSKLSRERFVRNAGLLAQFSVDTTPIDPALRAAIPMLRVMLANIDSEHRPPPAVPYLRTAYAWCLLATGDTKGSFSVAREQCESSIRWAPGNAYLWEENAELLVATAVRSGQFSVAEELLQRIFELEGDEGYLRFRRAGAAKNLAALYDAWHLAEPGRGFGTAANEWRSFASRTLDK